ncbi:dihydrofolate reductase family protein [Leptospira sp. 2 VSF19]|uniref:Dihydrofolate reductase family protein n=1 Tax=Leptospira soteropolitanensis TaxID=2950025 RepID=A0AAW5VLI7_9LEPT|nr:dihydrofolate reductase family protein [Leptospira soteropolitanensis]MCW7492481.1 dihydrofolate reductase family protein [Leptospira soteropolitanensis]MCW7500531.1 dihydrofolate reductase family protein [Leptospira soteropolitanensis]MCW7522799.1 dihydrofolate reductase family protein [Leptospira soteropolitanensis]MCW7526657.1 dihydrofolate reductase family protein [Leptospira soteropolitanensis]MCW7530501.1 dihydrofolate reductase family protein [Leptospira soteropolitanensis]
MIEYKAFIASSLDGFIARTDGSLDWLTSEKYKLENIDFGYTLFMQSIDCIVMGRVTFETVMQFESYPFPTIPVFVLTQNPKYQIQSNHPIFIFNGTLENLTSELENRQFKSAYVDGGQVIQSFIHERKLSEITITRISVLLGSGLTLFGNLDLDQNLKHIKTIAYANGFVQSEYHFS